MNSAAPIRSDSVAPGRHARRGPRFVDRLRVDPAAQRRDLVAGLLGEPASIAPKYFYDGLGAALYAAICEVPEYYLTRTERAIFTRHRDAIVGAIGRGTQLVDLGAGDCAKAAAWLPQLEPSRYVAVDIAADTLVPAVTHLALEFPDVEMIGVVTDFAYGLELGGEIAEGPVTFFYPGSSIGNFTPVEAREFLAQVRRHCAGAAGSGLLIGVDTRKDPARLEAAYDDRLGVTAAFNRNVLLHVNRVLGSDFDPQCFAHVAFYDAAIGRIEMHLAATRDSVVRIDGVPRHFRAGERIHTENSYKYSPQEFAALLEAVGFARLRLWQDDAGDFAVYHALAR